MAITDRCLALSRPHRLGGVQRVYRLPNGFGLSALNSPELHSWPFAWEIAVVSDVSEDGQNFKGPVYDTPLTSDVEVFDTDDEASAFIDRAIAWAEGKP